MNKPLLFWNFLHDTALVAKYLSENKLIIGSTDTVFGFFSSATQEGVDVLNKAKGRQNKPYLLFVSSQVEIIKLVDFDNLFHLETLFEILWPGPLTVIFKAKKNVPAYLQSAEGTISFRIPKHAGIQELLRHIPLIFSTSANRTGMPVARSISSIDQVLVQSVEAIITDENDSSTDVPSTIIDCSKIDTGIITMVREGAIAREEIAALLPSVLKLV